MARTAFGFYRAGARLMALDLAGTPSTGLNAQICGDAHLSNFGVYGSPERELVFDLNDFDETLPGPWEWDLKRLATSFAIAARHNGHSRDDEIQLATETCAAYRSAMAKISRKGYLEAWYLGLTFEEIQDGFSDKLSKKRRRSADTFARKARSKDSHDALGKLAERSADDSGFQIVLQPGLVVPLRDLPVTEENIAILNSVTGAYADYVSSVPHHLQILLGRYTLADVAVKVVGVGSVGTRCFVVLLSGKKDDDVLFLQVKEAARSVLEESLPTSVYTKNGQRVVEGQRLMQAASDSFLGWTYNPTTNHHYYWRQLKDMKASPEIDGASVKSMRGLAQLTGWTLARAHARSGDAAAIAGYLGSGNVFDEAVASFAVEYADQNEADHGAFVQAIRAGRIEASDDE
jgi:uncharacterized protein (DUF2252 family)